MDRTKAVELLNKALGCLKTDPKDCPSKCSQCENHATKEDGIEALSMAIKALEKAPTWIPVSKRLPKEGRDVLITKEPLAIKGYEQEVIKAKRSVDPRSGKIEWWSPEFGTLAEKTVLAWMSLPEVYKEGE